MVSNSMDKVQKESKILHTLLFSTKKKQYNAFVYHCCSKHAPLMIYIWLFVVKYVSLPG